MPSFEKAIEKLEEISEQLRSGDLSIEESTKLYQESVKYFEFCNKTLAEAKQKIEIYRPESNKVEDFTEC